jgi:hypothetical protein
MMSDNFEKLRKTIFAELERQAGRPATDKHIAGEAYLGMFLEQCLVNLGKSRDQFAQQLGIERELADAILEGLLPASEIDDALLVEIARVVEYEPNLLRIALGRPTVPIASGKDS